MSKTNCECRQIWLKTTFTLPDVWIFVLFFNHFFNHKPAQQKKQILIHVIPFLCQTTVSASSMFLNFCSRLIKAEQLMQSFPTAEWPLHCPSTVCNNRRAQRWFFFSIQTQIRSFCQLQFVFLPSFDMGTNIIFQFFYSRFWWERPS